MIRTVISLILIVASILAIVLFAAPKYRNTQDLREEVTRLENALQKAADLRRERSRLLEEFNAFTDNDLEKLETMLPASVDNVKLSIDIEQLAARHGLVLKDASVEEARNVVTDVNAAAQELGTLEMGISLLGRYSSFVDFIAELEKSLRIIDVQAIGFAAQQRSAAGNNDYYEFTVQIATYWLR